MQTSFCPRCETCIDAGTLYCHQCGLTLIATGSTTRLVLTEFKHRYFHPRLIARYRTQVLVLATAIISFIGGLLFYPRLAQPRPLLISVPGASAGQSVASTYLALNVNQYPTFTVYWKQDLWEQAVDGAIVTEDFSQDAADYGVLSFPYLTGHGLLLQGQSAAQILQDTTLLTGGNLLHFRDWHDGLNVRLPNDLPVRAFGFDYRPSESWRLTFNNADITIPKGRRGFVGVVFHEDNSQSFVLSCPEDGQGGLTIDNIAFVTSPTP
jgi:hypothetical protein